MHVGNVVGAPGDLVVTGVGAGRLDERQRLGGWREGQLFGVVGIVQTQREHAAGGRWQPLDLGPLRLPAIGQAQAVVVFDGGGVNLTFITDTCVFHGGLLLLGHDVVDEAAQAADFNFDLVARLLHRRGPQACR